MLDSEPDPNPNQPLLIPLKLDAFVFNSSVCDGKLSTGKSISSERSNTRDTAAKIAPIEQPNYTFLRLNSTLVQPDILNPVDLHNSWPGVSNSRLTDLGAEPSKPFPHRVGVYLHWTLPRFFRSSVTPIKLGAIQSDDFAGANASKGLLDSRSQESGKLGKADSAAPIFPCAPNRWLVIRHIPDSNTIFPTEARGKVSEFSAWVVESDRLWALKSLNANVDLQTDVSPFIAASGSNKGDDGKDKTVSKQAEVFIGAKYQLEDWAEQLEPENLRSDFETGATEEQKAQFLPQFSLLSSSNQLFADYQPHNSNVFSMCDNFSWADGQYLSKADAHYYVVGWHARPGDDLFYGSMLNKCEPMTRQARLDLLKLKLKLEGEDGKQVKDEKSSEVFASWLQSSSLTRSVCHGSMYDVKWDVNKKPDNVPADEYSSLLNNALPLAVGTTPLDALTTYTRAHSCLFPPPAPDPSPPGLFPSDPPGKVTIPLLEHWIASLERHLLARDDGVETQNQASDMLYNWNYVRVDGGEIWNAAGMDEASSDQPGGTPLKLIETLSKLNTQQAMLDSISRAKTQLRRDLFSLWWRCVTDPVEEGGNDSKYKADVNKIMLAIASYESQADICTTEINSLADSSVKKAAKTPFHQQRDPTLLVAGIRSGWQHDYLDKLLVRLSEQTIKRRPAQGGKDIEWDRFNDKLVNKLPKDLRGCIKDLVEEFLSYRPEAPSIGDSNARKTTTAPLFHDQLSYATPRPSTLDTEPSPPLWRDRWNDRQPWFPLFLEWEVEYHHIPFELWELKKRGSRSSTLAQLRYGIPKDTDLSKWSKLSENVDKHRIEGRVLLLPQPAFSLAAKIDQLFTDTPKTILDHQDRHGNYDLLSPEERQTLQHELHRLAFLSAPLAGLTAHLSTLLQGSHIKPSLRDERTGELQPIEEAMRPNCGFKDKQLGMIGIETDSTPFGTSVKPPKNGQALFKPAVHGQFQFTRLNIIDKFGQAIHAIDPTPTLNPQRVWPCVSEWYAPQLRKGSRKANTVEANEPPRNEKQSELPTEYPDPSPAKCAFMQIPPMINQLSRLNANFVKIAKDGNMGMEQTWRPAHEWENPIWGWVLINYANMGIQLFTAEGAFYREVRLAGPNGTQQLPAWLPFRPSSAKQLDAEKRKQSSKSREVEQLERLVARLGTHSFLWAFWHMIDQATASMQPAPEAYAAFTNTALIGRPLALVHAGWSLELAVDQLTSQCAEDNLVPRTLLAPDKKEKKHEQYTFPLYLGDKQRGFDGLVGMFPCAKAIDTDLGLDLKTVYSDYYAEKDFLNPEKPIGPTEPLTLQAFYPKPSEALSAADLERACNAELEVRGLLLDPFTPVHAYSGILPVSQLQLPAWTWQGALNGIKAFFHAGPIVLTTDVPDAFDATKELLGNEAVHLPPVDKNAVLLPSLGVGDWAWLQPYYPDVDQKTDDDALERYMILPVAEEDERARFSEGPYTAVEGYVMMVDGKKKKDGVSRASEISNC